MPISQKGGQFKKSLVPLSRRNYVLSVGFKMKPLRKSFSCIKTETNSNFAENLAEMHPFISVYLMNHISQTSALFNMRQ